MFLLANPRNSHNQKKPADISRISLFRNGEWVGDGLAKELLQADGSVRQVSLAQWNEAKRLARSQEDGADPSVPEELAQLADIKALETRRLQEKKKEQRKIVKQSQPNKEQDDKMKETVPSMTEDEETKRILRFFHR